MFEANILLNSADKIRYFNTKINSINCDVDIIAGHFEIDAKSLVGLFTLDTSKILKIRVNTEDEELINHVKEIFKAYIV